MTRQRWGACALLAACLAALPAAAVVPVFVWTGTNSGNWSDPANWGGSGPTSGGTGTLSFPAGAPNPAMVNDLTGFTIAGMTFSDTTYSLAGNVATLSGAITVDAGGTLFGTVNVNIDLALSGDATLTSTDGRYLQLGGVVSGPFGLTAAQGTGTHSGVVILAGANAYTGATNVSSGYLVVRNDSALGFGDGTGATGTVVASGATLDLDGANVVNEALSIGGPGASSNGALQSTGSVPNSWGGPITLTADVAFLANPQPITIGGVISGAFGVSFTGLSPASFSLSGTNTYSGISSIQSGKVFVDGSQPASAFGMGATINENAQLGGSGTVGPIFMGSGTTFSKIVAPGDAAATGILTCLGASLNDTANGNHGVFSARLNGTTAGSGYDQLNVLGTVDLTGAALSVTLGYPAAVGDTFVLIANDGTDAVTGTFNGLPENALLTVGTRVLRISYAGGTGNDVTLKVQSVTPVELSRFVAD